MVSLPAIPFQKVRREFGRHIVIDPTGEAPGTIVVRLNERHLFWVQEGGEAIRYSVGIGKAGFEWNGRGRDPVHEGVDDLFLGLFNWNMYELLTRSVLLPNADV